MLYLKYLRVGLSSKLLSSSGRRTGFGKTCVLENEKLVYFLIKQ